MRTHQLLKHTLTLSVGAALFAPISSAQQTAAECCTQAKAVAAPVAQSSACCEAQPKAAPVAIVQEPATPELARIFAAPRGPSATWNGGAVEHPSRSRGVGGYSG